MTICKNSSLKKMTLFQNSEGSNFLFCHVVEIKKQEQQNWFLKLILTSCLKWSLNSSSKSDICIDNIPTGICVWLFNKCVIRETVEYHRLDKLNGLFLGASQILLIPFCLKN